MKMFDLKVGTSQNAGAGDRFVSIRVYNDYLYALSSNAKVLKFEVNTGHCISSFGSHYTFGSHPLRQVLYMFKEHVAVAYPNQITFFTSDNGAVAFSVNPVDPQGRQPVLFGGQSNQNGCCYFTASGNYLYTCHGTLVHKYHYNKKQHMLQFEGHTDAILALVVHENFLFTSSKDNTIKKWDIKTGANLETISGHLNPVNRLLVSDNFLYSASSDCLIKKWTLDLKLSG
jgi:WD40 repeat protein